jgi:hypothetical protein
MPNPEEFTSYFALLLQIVYGTSFFQKQPDGGGQKTFNSKK